MNSGQISNEGSNLGKALESDLKDKEALIITYWKSYEEHENSHWHRITKTETLHFYSGSPLNVYTSKDGVEFQIDEIGSNNNFMYTVEKGTWFALKSTGSYSLIGCTVAPAFQFEDLELAPKDWKPSTFDQQL